MMPVIAAYPNPPRLRALSLLHPSFYILSQSGERPKRYIEFLRLETMPAAARADAWPLAARAQQGERVRCILETLETLETLENYPEVTGTSGRASTWSHMFIRARPDESLRQYLAAPSRA